MVGDNGNLQHGIDPRLGRRRLLTAGAAALPVIFTLRARPALAQINLNYENIEYRYGIHAGKTSEQVHEEREGGGLPPSPSPSPASPFGENPFGGSPFGSPPAGGTPFGRPPGLGGTPLNGGG